MDSLNSRNTTIRRLDKTKVAHTSPKDSLNFHNTTIRRLAKTKAARTSPKDSLNSHKTTIRRLAKMKAAHTYPMDALNSHDTTIRRHAKSSIHSGKIVSLIESYKKDPRITQEHFFSTLIRAYGLARMSIRAYRLFREMEKFGTPRSSISFNALLSVYIACRKFEAVAKLFDEIPNKYCFSPDSVSYSILIKSYSELNLFESAISVLDDMERNNVQITCSCYALILDALYKKGKNHQAEKLWKIMVGKRCSPDVVAYNTRIIHARSPEYVLTLLKEMTAVGMKPNTVSYNYLFKSYCVKGRMGEACKLLQDLEKYGCTPNKTTYRMAIDYLSSSGYIKLAYEILKEYIDKGGAPPFRILRALVQGLVRNSMEGEAKVVVRTLKEKFPDTFFNTSKWKKLEVSVLRCKYDKESPSKTKDASA
ncbi:hypothetical protein ACHQM5_006846 [Ranunculus cassubicifolius]